ncbi:ABC transporter substrate-binding protein [Paenibacillus sp. MSJ-34]|uniref:ABC transporter substrate-binding protein n=1 Tax=Paenibacillus sp. MSJ-34 TaxID=2841529 RepID=UPI001C11A031|nr:extracellular solute-binding protein [Paenibacillus sp. MSJ-34]MBU5441526.1 extracellular solute-binding protein [Paenibacillus sp. MSJ-34]
MKSMKLLLLSLILAIGLAGCGTKDAGNTGSNADKPPETGTEQETKTEKTADPVTLKFFTALADRTNGIGKVEQDIIDAYMNENPNVKIEVEALQDEPYKSKIKVYASTNELPDIIQAWGQPSFLSPLLDNDLLLELNPSDFASSNFVAGSLDGFSKDGKLFGLPRNTDYAIMYYNKQIFADNGIEVPKTTDDLLAAVKKLRENKVNPIAMNGMDGWTLPIWYDYVAQRVTGDFNVMDQAFERQISFTDERLVQAAANMQEFAKAKGFADGWLTADYGAARNLFGQGQAAMFFMGNWEAGLATDTNFSEEFRNNVGAFPFPASDKGKETDITAWYGGGYAISKNSKHQEAAVDFMKYFFQPDHWPKQVWQSGAGTPAQKFDEFLTGDETELQKQLIDIFNNMTSSSGTPLQDVATDEFKQKVMEAHQSLLNEKMTPEEFAKALDAAADKVAGK